MKVVRESNDELVLRASSIWISVICFALGALPLLYGAIRLHSRGSLFMAGFFLLSAAAWLRSSTFCFDAQRKQVRWQMLRFLKRTSGTVSFAEITDVVLETSSGSDVPTYRLALVTATGSIPLSSYYEAGSYTAMRERVLHFVKPGVAASSAAESELEACVRVLLQQGRRADAITLLRTTGKMDLLAASQRAMAIEEDLSPIGRT